MVIITGFLSDVPIEKKICGIYHHLMRPELYETY